MDPDRIDPRTDKHAPEPSGGSSGPDWRSIRELVLRGIRIETPDLEPSILEDLAQECMLKVFRYSRQNAVDSYEALATKISRDLTNSYFRRKARWRLQPLDPTIGAWPSPGLSMADAVERIRFIALAVFRDTECHLLAVEHFKGRKWPDIAAQLGDSYGAVRKRWSRCVERLRDIIQRCPDPVLDGLR